VVVKTKDKLEVYAQAVDSAHMRNIRLLKSDFLIEPESISGDRKAWKNGVGCRMSSSSYNQERKVLTALITANAYSKVGRKKIVSLKCEYAVAYDIQGAPDEAAVHRFAERVGTFAAYPYFRAHFATITAQAGISMPPLPVLKEGPRVIPRASVREAAKPRAQHRIRGNS